MRAFMLALAVSLATGCALDPSKAAGRPTATLCQIAVTGGDGWNTYTHEARLTAEQEAARRGVNCMDHADSLRADEAARRAAMGAMGQRMLENSGWSSTPRAALGPTPSEEPAAMRTTCSEFGDTTTCTTHWSDGSAPTITRCRKFGSTTTCE